MVEPSAGCDRTILAMICEAYDEEELVDDKGKKDVRTCLLYTSRMRIFSSTESFVRRR